MPSAVTSSTQQTPPPAASPRLATAKSGRLPVGLRCKHYAKYFLNKLTGQPTRLDVDLAGKSVSLSVTARREIRRAHAVHHEIDFIERMSGTLQAGDVVYDIGANIGVITVLLAKHNGGCAEKIFSFEPDPKNFRQLNGNVEANALQQRVSTHSVALGASEGEVSLHIRGDAGEGRHSISESKGATDTITVPLMTVSGFARDSGSPPDLIKIDVEGAEGQVLAGLAELTQKRPPRDIFLEIHSKGEGDKMPDGQTIHQWFMDNGYQMVWNVERRSGEHRQYRSDQY